MTLTIITPCSRPNNLHIMSLYIPKDVRWIVVFDNEVMPLQPPSNCEAYCHTSDRSIVGNAQRNYGLTKVTGGYVYFLDDDTLLHPELYDVVKKSQFDFIHFMQAHRNGGIRLVGDKVGAGDIDTGCFVVKAEIAKAMHWAEDQYVADGYYAAACYSNSKTTKHINHVLSVYNALQ